MRKIIILLALFISITSMQSFAVDYGSWLFDNGIIKGVDGDIQEERYLTRAELIVLLVRLVGREDVALNIDFRSSFTDVDGHWAYPYIAYGQNTRLVSGYGDGRFGPDDPVSSTQLASFLLKVLSYGSSPGLTWENTLSFAKDIGLDLRIANPRGVTRGEVFRYLYNALHLEVNTTGETLGSRSEVNIPKNEVASIVQLDEQTIEIVFTSAASPVRTIFRIISDENIPVDSVSWSPDGRIAFVKTKGTIPLGEVKVFIYGYESSSISFSVNQDYFKKVNNQKSFYFDDDGDKQINLIDNGSGRYEIPYLLYNQEGSIALLPNYQANSDGVIGEETIGGVRFTSSNTRIVNPDQLQVRNGQLSLPVPKNTSRQVKLSAYTLETGQEDSINLVVDSTSRINRVIFTLPSGSIYEDEPIIVNYQIYDQFGFEILPGDALYSKVTFSQGINKQGSLIYVPKVGENFIGAYFQSELIGSVNVTALASRKAVRITGYNGLRHFEDSTKARLVISQDDFTFAEQNGNPIRLTGDDQISVFAKDGTFDVIKVNKTKFSGVDSVELSASKNVGAETIVFRLNNDSSTDLEVKFKVIDNASIGAYRLFGDAQIYAPSSSNDRYDVSFPVYGSYYDAGEQFYVVLDQSFVTSYTSSKLSVVNTDIFDLEVFGVSSGTATIIAWSQGIKLASKNVWVVETGPRPVTITQMSKVINMARYSSYDVRNGFVVKDQYNVAISGIESIAIYEQSGIVEVYDKFFVKGSSGASASLIVTFTNGEQKLQRIRFN